MALGRTLAGRYLRVVYVPDPDPNSVFVITAYELRGKPLIAYRQASPSKGQTMKQKRFPTGWDEERVRKVLMHYEEQTEDEAVAEDEAAFENRAHTVMEVPAALVPAARELLAKYQRNLTEGRRGKQNPVAGEFEITGILSIYSCRCSQEMNMVSREMPNSMRFKISVAVSTTEPRC